MLRIAQEALTFDDVLLVPGYSEVLPRSVCLRTRLTRSIELNIPLISSAMDAVTEARLAIAMAQEGGMGVIHKNLTSAQQAEQVRKVKKHESGIVSQPVTIELGARVGELLRLRRQHSISGVPVLDGDQLVGIITSRDVRFETNLSRPIAELMTPRDRLITVREGTTEEEVLGLLQAASYREGAGAQ